MLDVPKQKKSEVAGPIEWNQNDSAWGAVNVKAAAEGIGAEANGKILSIREKDGGKDPDAKTRPVEVELTQEITAKSGSFELTGTGKEKKIAGSATVVVNCSLRETQQRR